MLPILRIWSGISYYDLFDRSHGHSSSQDIYYLFVVHEVYILETISGWSNGGVREKVVG